MSSTLKATMQLVSGRALAFGATFFIPVILARIFAPAAFGTYKQLMLVHVTLFAIAQLGMAESLYYFLPRAPEAGGRQVANTLLLLGAAGLLSWVALEISAPALGRVLGNPELARYVGLLGVFVLLTLLSAPLEIVLVSRNRHAAAAWTYGLADLARAALIVLPALWFRSLGALLAGVIAFGILRLLATLVVLVREYGRSLRPDLRALRLQLAYALPFGLAAIVETIHGSYHQFAVSSRFDAATFAVFSVGCLQVPLVDWVASPAANVMMVRMAERRDDAAVQVDLWHETTRRLATIFVPLVALLLLVAPDLIAFLFTPRYAAAAPVLRVWCVIYLFSVLQTDAVLRAFAQTPFLLVLNLLSLGVVAAAIPACIARFGLPGAVLAALLATAVAKASGLFRIARLLRTGLRELLPWRHLAAILLAAAAAAVPAAALKSQLASSSFGLLAATSIVYSASYLVLAAAWVLTAGERRAVLEWAGQALGRPVASGLPTRG
jgi:O-antigen/teichoic acid export membrane protein